MLHPHSGTWKLLLFPCIVEEQFDSEYAVGNIPISPLFGEAKDLAEQYIGEGSEGGGDTFVKHSSN